MLVKHSRYTVCMTEENLAPYPTSPTSQQPAATDPSATTQPPATPSKYRTIHLQRAKDENRKFAMMTSYDAMTAKIFNDAGIEVLLIGDSLGNTVLGMPNTLAVTLDDMITFSAAVSRSASRSLVVADLPFGSYESSVAQAVDSGIRLVKEASVAAVKLEGGIEYCEHVRALTSAGVAVMAHIGFTPQSENVLGGYRVQGREDSAEETMIRQALALQEAGAFAVLMEMVPAQVAEAVDQALDVPTVGIGAGPGTTGQVLVWQDALGLNQGRVPRFVKQYATVGEQIHDAAQRYRHDVLSGTFPSAEHSF